MILIIARTARVVYTTATNRKTTLIVPRTTCSGPVMVLPTPHACGADSPVRPSRTIAGAQERLLVGNFSGLSCTFARPWVGHDQLT
jgi:hypothetical protein